MKKIYYLGLTIFYIGVILFLIKSFKPNYFNSIDDTYIDYIWPIGLLIYSLSKLKIDKTTKQS